MPNIGRFSERVGSQLIQYGIIHKGAAEQTVRFAEDFSEPPFVVLSPLWERENCEVGHAETIDRISRHSFTLVSHNGAPNYFVCWIAVGAHTGRPEVFVDSGDLRISGGRQRKPDAARASVHFEGLFAGKPNVQLSPQWEGQRRGVGCAPTLDHSEDALTMVSNNVASNYFTHYLAIGSRPGAPEANEFLVGDTRIRIGRTRKTVPVLPISLETTGFAEPPAVIVTPSWEGHGVGHAETISLVESRFFTTVSGNAAPNYFVSWIAIGPARSGS